MPPREGNLEAPTRHAVPWREASYHDEADCQREMARVFDICHGCRRCVSLCQSFPTLFDLVDATDDGEVHGVDTKDYAKVVDQCYLCDLAGRRGGDRRRAARQRRYAARAIAGMDTMARARLPLASER